jgi:prepilin-type N-terminal cleavage/methylation domain-containing protein
MRSTTRRAVADAGMTLIELLVTITIMGIVFAVFVGGIGLAIRASDEHRRVVSADTVLRNAAERLQALGYKACDQQGWGYSLTAPSDPSDLQIQPPVLVGYLSNGADAHFAAPSASDPPCPSDGGAQLVKITVSSTANRAVRDQTLEVVKRR